MYLSSELNLLLGCCNFTGDVFPALERLPSLQVLVMSYCAGVSYYAGQQLRKRLPFVDIQWADATQRKEQQQQQQGGVQAAAQEAAPLLIRENE